MFILFNLSQTHSITFTDWLDTLYHAFPLDLSVASYLTVIPGLLIVLSCFINKKAIEFVMSGYHYLFLFICVLTFTTDAMLYGYWGFKLDNTIFIYLSSFATIIGNVEYKELAFGCLFLLCYYVLLLWCYRFWIKKDFRLYPKVHFVYGVLFFLATGLLFIPIRGGLGASTMNISRVYFSNNMFLNHAAVNPLFNLLESSTRSEINKDKYRFMTNEEAKQMMCNLLSSEDTTAARRLPIPHPNIIMVILESFSATMIESLGGVKGVTPNLDRYGEKGIYFKNAYGSSFRTDRGVVSVLSGYPAQPTTSIMKIPQKTENLPSLSKALQPEGYQMTFYYGGDENFTSMRSYLVSSGFHERISQSDFPLKQQSSSWGVPDEFLFQKVLEDLTNSPSQPFFKAMLTLSSHPPFDVPGTKKFDNEVLNAMAYTDSCLGFFLDSLRTLPLWKNTLVILVADHSMIYPSDLPNHLPLRYQIPIIFTGGVIQQGENRHNIVSQIDIVPTVLSLLGLPATDFPFGKNMLDTNVPSFAFYSYPDVFGFISESGVAVYDCTAKQLIYSEQAADTNLLQGKAYLQSIYSDFLHR